MDLTKRSKRYENSFIRRINSYGSIEAAITSFRSGNTGSSHDKFIARKRKEYNNYSNSNKKFKELAELSEKMFIEDGRTPVEYERKDLYKKEYDIIARNIKRCGLPKKTLATWFNVSKKTVSLWFKHHESLNRAWDMAIIEDIIKVSNAMSRSAKFHKRKSVTKEVGFIEIDGVKCPTEKTITKTTEYPPITAHAKLKLAQLNNGGLLGYIPPVAEVQENPIKIDIELHGSDDDFSLNDNDNDSTNSENKKEEEKEV